LTDLHVDHDSSAIGGNSMRAAYALASLVALLAALRADDKSPPTRVLIQTEKGDIEVELYADKAPATVANFLRYVDAKLYDDGRFHRTVKPDNQSDSPVKIAVIQGKATPGREKDLFDPIKLERTRDTKL